MKNLTSVGQSQWMGTMGPGEGDARGQFILNSQRFRVLDRKQSYFDCTQHDQKGYDFDGRIINTDTGSGVQAGQPLIGESASWAVPLKLRRPSKPYRLARVITNSFTARLFGDQRFPTLNVPMDPKTQDYVQTISTVANLPIRMIQARNMGGSTGTACMSWAYIDGKPRVRVHNPKFCYVHEWEDRDEFIPRHVIECFKYSVEEWNSGKRKLEPVEYWHRRDWLPEADLVFAPCRVERGTAPQWVPDLAKCVQHNDGVAHFVWIQNLPSDGIDGECDYEGLFDNFDTLDVMASVLSRGAVLNLDPTLVLKVDPDAINDTVLKGSGNALKVGTDGDAKYLELVGSSITVGINLFNRDRETTLEVAQCVLPDPDKIAAAGTSSIAMKIIYTPMLGKSDILREQYGSGLRRLLEPALVVAQKASRTRVIYLDPETLQEKEEYRVPVLPPKVVKTIGPDGEPSVKLTPREPGVGTLVELTWGPYFQATPQDRQITGGMLFQATGQKQYLSVQTASEELAKVLDRDSAEEWQRMQAETQSAESKQNQMFADATGAAGGKVQHTMPTAGGGQMTRTIAPPMPEASVSSSSDSSSSEEQLPLTPTTASAIITVNEARKSLGLDLMPEPDGHLSLAAFQAKYATPIAQAANAALGKVGTSPAGDAPPKPVGITTPGAPGASLVPGQPTAHPVPGSAPQAIPGAAAAPPPPKPPVGFPPKF